MHVERPLDPKLQWFPEARFGMFVHFGLYALLGRGEWVMLREDIRRDDYEPLMHEFNPAKFDADEWVQTAKRAGCRYMTVTAKHHDGFCLWDTDLTDFKITTTPFGRDLIGELIDACHRHDFRICLYYSQPDWHHPNYVHRPGAFKDLQYERPEDEPDWEKFLEFYHGQVEELCTKYGRIDGIWFDGVQRTEEEWQGEAVYRMIKRHQPAAVVNDRAGYGDFYTPERTLSHLTSAAGYMVEACESICQEVWGYHRNPTLYSSPHLLESLIRMAAAGGNYLLNVGPKPDGALPENWVRRLYDIGGWLETYGEAIYGTDGAPMHMSEDVVYTRSENRVFAHLLHWPTTNRPTLEALAAVPENVQMLNSDADVSVTESEEGVALSGVPSMPDSPLPTVVELDFATDEMFRPVPEPGEPEAIELDEITILAPDRAAVGGFGIKGSVLSVSPVDDESRAATGSRTAFASSWIPGQEVEWLVEASEADSVNVTVEIACPPENAGGQFRVTVGDTKMHGEVPATDGFDDFAAVELGTVEIPAGETHITMEPVSLKYAYCFGRVGSVILRQETP
ncbi:MAG: alpha-L-fucosidase [Armatimonadota bacterium]